MRERGLIQAIVIRPYGERFRLVAGAHRLAAAHLLDWSSIRAEIRRLTDDEARAAEIDENLDQRGLDALDRSLFLTEKQIIWERLYPETKNGGDRVSEAARSRTQSLRSALGIDLPPTFSEDAAERTGLSQRSIQLALEIGRGLSPEAIRHLRETKLTNNASALRIVAKEIPAVQVQLARRLASGEAKTIGEAREQLGLSLPSAPASRQVDPEHVRRVLYGEFTRAWEATEDDPELRARCLKYLRDEGVRV